MKALRLLSFAFVLIGATADSFAQSGATSLPPGAKEVPVRNLAVCFLFAPTTPELYFKDAHGKYQRLLIDTTRFETWNVVPATATLELFKKKAAAADTTEKTVYETALTWPMPEGADSVRKLYYYGAKGETLSRDFPTGTETHKALQLRVINLLEQQALVRIGTLTKALAPKSEEIVTAASVPNERFGFQFGYQLSGEPAYVSPLNNFRFVRPHQRLTMILGYLPISEFSDSGASRIVRFDAGSLPFYEDTSRVPAPPKPVVITASLAWNR